MKKLALSLILSISLVAGLAPLAATGGTKTTVYEWCCGTMGQGGGLFVLACLPGGNEVCYRETCHGFIL